MTMPAGVAAGSLPQVAPAGPGMPSNMSTPGTGDTLDDRFQRRLQSEKKPGEPVVTSQPAAGIINAGPGGITTDNGTPLTGDLGTGVLRDSSGGTWNCTSAGCFAPDGRFLPMRK